MIDLTLPLREGMLAFPGNEGFEPETLATLEADGKRLNAFRTNAHQGTHVDAPAHYIEDGVTIDEVAVDRLVGPATVVDLRDHAGTPIDADRLEAELGGGGDADRVILVTGDVDAGYSNEAFFDQASYLTVDGAEWLVGHGVDLVANDCMTEAVPGDPDRPVHKTLLGAGVPIVEYLSNTAAIADVDEVEFLCLPLSIPGFEAAPARAAARVPDR